MLKVFLMIDCNDCGRPFDRVTSSNDTDPIAWRALQADLEWTAQRRGWTHQRSAHYCDWCVSDAELARTETIDDDSEENDEDEPF
jgi:hypothetical protein